MPNIEELITKLDHQLIELKISRAEWCRRTNFPQPALSYLDRFGQALINAINETLGEHHDQ